MSKQVIMHAITYVGKDGLRVLTHPNQNRYFKRTKKEADEHLKAMLTNNSADTIKSIFGDAPDFKVIPVEMWGEDGDAKRTVF